MSKTRNRNKKSRRRRKEKRRKSSQREISPALHRGLLEARELLDGRQWEEALELLEGLARRYPHSPYVFGELANLYYELEDAGGHLWACQRLAVLQGGDPDVCLMLAGSSLANSRPALALRAFRHFLDQWPEDPRADGVRKTVAEVGVQFQELVKDFPVAPEDRLEFAATHEEILCLLDRGEFEQCCRLTERLLQEGPAFVPALNNRAEALFRLGRAEEAVAADRRALEIDADNFHALANLVRHLFLSGCAEEARRHAERLKALDGGDDDLWVKKAEALSFLGDDQGVLAARDAAGRKRKRRRPDGPDDALLHHLAAVATMRLGNQEDARKLWKRALKANPGLETALENLDDLDHPVGERHAPWAYGLANWIPENTFDSIISRLSKATRRRKPADLDRNIRQCLQQHPHLAALLPALLDRGDPMGREFALKVITLAHTPELLELLREFATSNRGPDELRQQAAQTLREADMWPAEPVRMWVKGKWKEIVLYGFEITDEPLATYPPEVNDLAYEAALALKDDDGEKAERLLQQALKILPDSASLLNNLAMAYEVQGRREEAHDLMREIHRRDPDYLFARLAMARLYMKADDLDQAKEMLRPLITRPRFHVTEFRALCSAQIDLCLLDREPDAAQSWIDMWEKIDPECPDLGQPRVSAALGKLARFGR